MMNDGYMRKIFETNEGKNTPFLPFSNSITVLSYFGGVKVAMDVAV